MGKISEVLKKVNEERQRQRSSASHHEGADSGQNAVPDQVTYRQEEIKPIPFSHSGSPERVRPAKRDSLLKNLPLLALLKEKLSRVSGETYHVEANSNRMGIDPRVVAFTDSVSAISEQYRILRTNVKSFLKKNASRKLATRPVNDTRMFTIVSSLHNEGKTITAANLAVALAKDLENKVLLVDCDLRNGGVHEFMNVRQTPGVAEVLNGKAEYTQTFHATPLPNLLVIPRGKTPQNPSELLGSKKMKTFLNNLKAGQFAYVIIDTPPVTTFTDAGVLTAQTEGAIFVVQAHRTQEKVVRRAKGLLEHARANIMGFVMTQADYYVPDMYAYYYYRYGAKRKAGK
ncbi:MAG: polysaccharide biosynthesis tyrosine autokinase [Candidatus Omnitrophica bacterium]|nr:polysaccharide biosynthesis tyrosine autokinase [Candidatus Omnitrophota bacterium]